MQASVVEAIHALAPTPERRLLVSAAVLAGYLVLTSGVYALGDPLKARVNEEMTEAIQAGLGTVLGVFAGVLLVVVWRATNDVENAIGELQLTPETGVKVLLVVLAFALSYTVTRITKRLVRIGEGRDAITNHQREVLHHVLQIVVFVPAVLFGLALFAVEPSDLLLGAGAVSLVVGLAARQTLSAVLAGFVLLFSRPFEVGDWVEIDDNEGIVTDVSIVNTRLRTFDDEQVMIPNDQITDEAIVNRSRNDRLRVQVDVGVDYDTDVEHAAAVAVDAMSGLDEIMRGREPGVVVKEFGDSAVVLNLRFWIKNPTIQRKWNAQNAVIEAVKTAFEEEGITIPFPQRVLMGREAAGGLRVTAEGRGDAAADGATSGGADGDPDNAATADGSTDAADGTDADDPDGAADDGADDVDQPLTPSSEERDA